MILGLSLAQFTYLHVFLSMIGIGAGLFVVFGRSADLRSRHSRVAPVHPIFHEQGAELAKAGGSSRPRQLNIGNLAKGAVNSG